MKVNVCIVTFPLSEAGYTPLSNLVKVLGGLTNRVYVVSGGAALEKLERSRFEISFQTNVQTMKVDHRVSAKLSHRIVNYVHSQLKILRYVILVSRDSDLFVFSIGGEELFLPVLFLKFLRKRIVLMPGGIATKGYSAKHDSLSRPLSFLIGFTLSLADVIILYSNVLAQEPDFKRYARKIRVSHEHFVDFTKFTLKTKLDERQNIVGYIGRLSEEKGILNLLNAIPLVLKKKIDVHFTICGDGNLADAIKKIIAANGLETVTKLTKWVNHEDVPQYLNELKLLVLPSFTEGLPNILLEAMACGTPVLATRVGAISDIISDGETGFLLKSNNPTDIADKIIELLNKSDLLEKSSKNAYRWVRENFNQKRTINAWQQVLTELEISQ